MFREMNRKKQQLTEAQCVEILKGQLRGVLCVLGDEGYPYGTPINHYYSEEDGHLYFHSARKGHRVDAMRRCDKASFCVYNEGFRKSGDWALTIDSVVVFGRLKEVEDHEKALDISRRLSYKFTRDEEYIEDEVRRSGPGVLVFELIPEHMTGKRVNEK